MDWSLLIAYIYKVFEIATRHKRHCVVEHNCIANRDGHEARRVGREASETDA